MLDELRATPEVLYGLGIAFGIVVLLTPAVGGMARMLGAVDHPDSRRLNRRPIPRLGGLAIFLGILVPALAFLDLSGESRGVLLGAAIATVVGAIDDFRGLSPPAKLGGQLLAAAIPPAFGVWIDHFTLPFVGVVDLPAWLGVPLSMLFIVAVMNMVNFLDGLDGLAAGRLRDRGRDVRDPRPLARQGRPRDPLRDRRRRPASDSCATTSSRPGSSWATPARSAWASSWPRSPSRACSRPRRRSSSCCRCSFSPCRSSTRRSWSPAGLKHSRPIYTADRSHLHHRFLNIGFSQRRAAVTMWLWCASLAGAALATRFVPFREGGEWHLWETLVVAGIALVAIAFSVFVIYLLEIVKLMNPRIRRRESEQAETTPAATAKTA